MNPEVAPSQVLWVELTTRIATQRLSHRSGEEETAAESVASLFPKVRKLLEEHPEAKGFEEVALHLLNTTLRPYTARWHGWMTEEKSRRTAEGKPVLKFKDEWYRRQFRRELQEVQRKLRVHTAALDKLRSGMTLAQGWNQLETARAEFAPEIVEQKRSQASLGKSLQCGIARQIKIATSPESDPPDIVEAINKDEQSEIRIRRAKVGESPMAGLPVMDAAGIAFSGGGIRSATFCHGITQVLARRGLLKKFDYLSTVSGGGYFGSFLSSSLGWKSDSDNESPDHRFSQIFGSASAPATATGHPSGRAEPDVADTSKSSAPEPAPLRHLRNRSRYLIDNRFKDQVFGIGIVVAGVLFNLLILLPVPLAAALLTYCLSQVGWFGDLGWVKETGQWAPRVEAMVTSCLIVAALVTAVVIMLYPPFERHWRQTQDAKQGGRIKRVYGWCFFLTLAVTGLLLITWLVPTGSHIYYKLRHSTFIEDLSSAGGGLEEMGAVFGVSLAVLLPYLASLRKAAGWLTRVLSMVALLAGPALYLFVFFAVCHRMMFAEVQQSWDWRDVIAVFASVAIWGWVLVDVNGYSPHGYYRDRLSSCYLIRPEKCDSTSPDNLGSEIVTTGLMRLSELGASGFAPYHLINTTVNLPTSKVSELRGRRGDFYLFSKHYCGSPLCGYVRTGSLERLDPHVNLGTAMAISGAAASSNMGWRSMTSVRVLMTIANFRLGYWLRNPQIVKPGSRMPGPTYLFREMFAICMDEHQKYLNVSDGGHIENLGAYELLRRRCKFIVCVDAGMEPGMECEDLMRLERYAAIDLGIKMHYDLADLRLQANGYSRAYGVIVKVDYSPPKSEAERRLRRPEDAAWGWMLYIKLGMVGYGPGYVMDYKRQKPDFPHQSTGDQLYDEAQFEAYRALGESAAESLFAPEYCLAGNPSGVTEWFQGLVSAMLPDNDEVFRTEGHPGSVNPIQRSSIGSPAN